MKSPIHIAILPFRNLDEGEGLGYFSDGLTEGVINKLSLIDGLRVTARASVFQLKDSEASMIEVGRALNVIAIVKGAVQIAEDQLIISAQLITMNSDLEEVIWLKRWEKNIKDVFIILDQLSNEVAEKLREHFWHFDLEHEKSIAEVNNIEAYQYYLKGNHYYLKWNFEDVKKAIHHYEQAIALDQYLAEAYVGLSNCYAYLGGTGYIISEEALNKAQHFAQQAKALNHESPELYFALGGKYFWQNWDLQGSFEQLNKAIELNPSYADAHSITALIYMLIGKSSLAKKHINIALRLDPYSANKLFIKSWIHYLHEDYDNSIHFGNQALEKEPMMVPALFIKACAMLLKGQVEEVITLFEQKTIDKLDKSTLHGTLALAYSFNGNETQKRLHIQCLEEELEKTSIERTLAFLFLINAVNGHDVEAVKWLKRAFEIKLPLLLFLISDPLIKNIEQNTDLRAFKQKLLQVQGIKRILPKEAKNIPDDGWIEENKRKLLSFFEQETPYYDSTLTLKSLADQVDIHSNQLSWLINNQFGKNFNEFINHYRVEAFKRKVVDPENAHLTILGLAFECGFNSKSSFNTIFKREMGMTPRAYLKQIN